MEQWLTFKENLHKNWFNILLISIILILMLSPNAKSWMLRQVVSSGIFNAEIKSENVVAANNANHVSFTLMNDKGEKVAIEDLEGKVVFINFWASWCPPCRAEMPSLQNLYNKLKTDDRFAFIFINEDEDELKANKYLEKYDYKLPIYKRVAGVPSDIFNGTLPTTIVLNKSGQLVYRHKGMADFDNEEFINQLKSLL